MNALRVLVLEDDEHDRELLREALAELGPRVATIAEAPNLSDCRRYLDEGSFDLFLADLVLPDGLSIDTIRFARSLAAAPTVLVVSSLADEDAVVKAIMAGASGYVSKADAPVDMARAIAVAADGGSCISPTIAHRLMELLRKPAPAFSEACAGLTARESEILEMAAKGYNYRQIAELIGTRPSTVYTHVRHIYEKLQVCSLPQALFEARMRRLV